MFKHHRRIKILIKKYLKLMWKHTFTFIETSIMTSWTFRVLPKLPSLTLSLSLSHWFFLSLSFSLFLSLSFAIYLSLCLSLSLLLCLSVFFYLSLSLSLCRSNFCLSWSAFISLNSSIYFYLSLSLSLFLSYSHPQTYSTLYLYLHFHLRCRWWCNIMGHCHQRFWKSGW